MARKTSSTAAPERTFYDILQVLPEAEQEVITAAAKALLVKHHPDHGGDDELCKRISEAKSVLTNSEQREKYDTQIVDRAIGNTIGNYRLVRKISEGGFGEVYEAVHSLTGMRCCIKKNLEVSPVHTEIFLKEAAAIWDLRHHALPAVRDMYKLPDGKYAMVMSYVEGPTLEQLVTKYHDKDETIDPENVCWVSERVLDALRYMHYHGVVHGDVKPQNIIVQPDEHTCVLVDFGLASVRPKRTSRPDGYTPVFASPESLSDKPLLPESDLYSLGLTMIYMLGGDPISRRLPKGVPSALNSFIDNLTVYDVLKRPHWDDVDLVQKMREVRAKSFGRDRTNYKKL